MSDNKTSYQQLTLYNSLTQKKEVFEPIDKEYVRMYVCGPTVYRDIHVGNARPTIVFDLLYRILQLIYPRVIYVRNITDVDDKIIAESEKIGISISELTNKTILSFQQDMENLRNIKPTIEPKATEHMQEMIDMIEKLIESGFAYVADNHVFFAVEKFPEYGEVSKIKLDEMMIGARIDASNIKNNPADFVLWKPALPDEASWSSPWGNGRPGWHLECSAMSTKYLGISFDIHGGGHDLMFPHHENSNAQSRCAYNTKHFAKYWLHNGMMNVMESNNVEKMSKSLNNVVILKNILDQYSGAIIRYFILTTHYRKDMIWSNDLLNSAAKSLLSLIKACGKVEISNAYQIDGQVLQALLDDLNTPQAIARLHEMAKYIKNDENTYENKEIMRILLAYSMHFMGIFDKNATVKKRYDEKNTSLSEKEIVDYIQQRNYAKKEKNFAKADDIRAFLQKNGIELQDTIDGTTYFLKK